MKKIYTRVFAYCYSILRHRENAEDICQDVFLKLQQKEPELFLNNNFIPKVLTIARNKCIDLFRKNKRNYPGLIELNDLPDLQKNPEMKIINKEFDSIVLNCLQCMSLEYRSIIILRDINGFSYKDIAAHLKIETGRVKWVLFKARKQLKKLVEEYYEKN